MAYKMVALIYVLVAMATILILSSGNYEKCSVYKNFIVKNFELKKSLANHLPVCLLPLWCSDLSCVFCSLKYSNFRNPGSSTLSPNFQRGSMDT